MRCFDRDLGYMDAFPADTTDVYSHTGEFEMQETNSGKRGLSQGAFRYGAPRYRSMPSQTAPNRRAVARCRVRHRLVP
jgi:hypothetical protein